MIEVLIQTLDPADKLIEAEWRHVETLAKPTFFVSWDWAGTLIATMPARRNLSLLRLSERSETVGLAQLGRESALRHLFVWSERLHLNSPGEPLTIEDNLLLARPEFEIACWDAILKWFAREQNFADELVLQGLRRPLDLTVMDRYRLWYDNIPFDHIMSI